MKSQILATSPLPTSSMSALALFEPLRVGRVELQHRVALSAMTRLRCDPTTWAPRELNATYYAQRASPGGLVVSEGLLLSVARPSVTGKLGRHARLHYACRAS
jgi:2,4-dienoyl-CoA reductase-like NADH-dependent reductase (Old Yellow Enzyme family)